MASTPPLDGRSARALRTREAIVDACIGLVEEGELRPTAPRVAERAGVSVRSVFQHFDDLPALHSAVNLRVVMRLRALLHPVDPSLPLDARIQAFVRHRGALLEAMTPYQRAAQVHGPFSPEIREAVHIGNGYLREEVAEVFNHEIEQAPPADQRELLEALATVLSWATWDTMRSDGARSVDEAASIVRRLIRAILSPGS
jgi:TetR/AcrR family transcriptional regulator of autoinduction and epiphytic fitness